jgi:hypothetical protein
MMRTKSTSATLCRVGLAAAVAAAGSIALFQGVSSAAGSYTAAPAVGKESTAYIVTLTGTGFRSATNVMQVNNVRFATACGASTVGVLSLTINAPSATRLVVSVPATLPVVTGSSTAYKVCVFGVAAGNPLLGSSTFTVYGAPTISAISPTRGQAMGGAVVTVVGTNFTAKSTVKVGTVAATGVKVVNSTTLTATIPAQAAATAPKDVVVTTEGGDSTNTGGATVNDYIYDNAITISPSFGSFGTVLTIKGVGFNALTAAAKVMFVDGIYNPVSDAATTPARLLAQAGDCGDLQVISDTELVCTAPNLALLKAYTVTIVSDTVISANTAVGTTTGVNYTQTVVSSGSTFTYSSY